MKHCSCCGRMPTVFPVSLPRHVSSVLSPSGKLKNAFPQASFVFGRRGDVFQTMCKLFQTGPEQGGLAASPLHCTLYANFTLTHFCDPLQQ